MTDIVETIAAKVERSALRVRPDLHRLRTREQESTVNRDRYRAHEVREADPEIIARLASRVYHEGRGVYFTPEQLERMPQWSRELIESEAARYNGPRRR